MRASDSRLIHAVARRQIQFIRRVLAAYLKLLPDLPPWFKLEAMVFAVINTGPAELADAVAYELLRGIPVATMKWPRLRDRSRESRRDYWRTAEKLHNLRSAGILDVTNVMDYLDTAYQFIPYFTMCVFNPKCPRVLCFTHSPVT